MSREVKQRRGTTAEHVGFKGAEAEITVDTDKKTVVVHDGSTYGGFPLARADQANILGDGVTKIVALFQRDYDALEEIDDETLYVIRPFAIIMPSGSFTMTGLNT